jgi:predicted methyltransferase
MISPLLTLKVHETMRAAVRAGVSTLKCSLDLDRSTTTVELGAEEWSWQGQRFPYLKTCKDRTVYHWTGGAFEPAARFTTSLIKLVPTEWGPPTFEIDGIKMLPTAKVSPYADAERKVGLIQPRAKVILDTCGGLGYFATWCVQGGAKQVLSYEKNPDVIWLRSLNPWSPKAGAGLTLTQGDITERITALSPMPRSMPSCTTRRGLALPASSTRKSSITTWPGCSSATANCFTTPVHRTDSPAAAMYRTKSRSACAWLALPPS